MIVLYKILLLYTHCAVAPRCWGPGKAYMCDTVALPMPRQQHTILHQMGLCARACGLDIRNLTHLSRIDNPGTLAHVRCTMCTFSFQML